MGFFFFVGILWIARILPELGLQLCYFELIVMLESHALLVPC